MKKMQIIVLFLVLLAILMSGCTDQLADPDDVAVPDDRDPDEYALPEEIETWLEGSLSVFLGQARVYNGKLYLLVTYGEKTTGGYIVEITDLAEGEDRLVVTAHFVDPTEDDLVTQAFSYPYDLVVIADPGLPVEFLATGAREYLPTLYGIEYLPAGSYGSGGIRVTRPLPGDSVGNQFEVEGIGNVFEGNILYRLTDAEGKVIAEGFTTAMMGDWGFYSFALETGDLDAGSGIVLELFTESAKDGSIEDLISIDLSVR